MLGKVFGEERKVGEDTNLGRGGKVAEDTNLGCSCCAIR